MGLITTHAEIADEFSKDEDKLRAEIKVLKAERSRWAKQILAARDALIEHNDLAIARDECYHELYKISDPDFRKYIDPYPDGIWNDLKQYADDTH